MDRRGEPPDPSCVRLSKGAFLAVAVATTMSSAPPAWVAQARAAVTHAQATVADALAGPQFGETAFALESYHRIAGTYDGSSVVARGVVLRWATDRAYCVDGVTQGGVAEYLLGPGGHVVPGYCPSAAV
jgi:hypothetical protein